MTRRRRACTEAAVWMLVLSWVPAFADCASGGTTTLPAPGTALRGELVLQATGSHRDAFRSLDGAALVSGDARVPLELVATLAGTFDLSQWVLAPKTAPDPARRWTLEVGGAPLELYYDGARQPAAYPVEAGGAPLAWQGAPRVVSAAREQLGCGPAVSVVVEVAVSGAASVEVALRPVAGGEGGRARLPIEGGRISIGHGMCSGAFELEAGVEYLAELVAIDPAGGRAPAGPPLRFTAP